MSLQVPYKHETEVIWEKDPSNLKYLREFPVSTQKQNGLPKSRTRGYVVYGYTNVSQSVSAGPDGYIRKRMFVLKPKDAGGPENNGEHWQGRNTPAEAVEIESIEAGRPSTEMKP
jgi:hypothetical protein